MVSDADPPCRDMSGRAGPTKATTARAMRIRVRMVFIATVVGLESAGSIGADRHGSLLTPVGSPSDRNRCQVALTLPASAKLASGNYKPTDGESVATNAHS